MAGSGSTMEGSTKGPRVGRKRQPQPKEIARTLAGKFGVRLAGLTEAAGLTADTLGKAINKSGDSVRLYFAGTATPHINDWPKLAKALGVTVRELLPE